MRKNKNSGIKMDQNSGIKIKEENKGEWGLEEV